ncbi:MAG: hypothetical protein ACE5Z5_14450, partial [Candidatus Bathyarchaeia archaeon]
ILKRKMAGGSVEEEEVENLVRLHVEYIIRYLYKFSNRDRAHYEWEYDNIPLLRQRIDKAEIRLLHNILQKL